MGRRRTEPGAAVAPLSAEDLRRAALARSQRRGEQVARRRLAWRWTVWGLARLVRFGTLPVLVIGLGLGVYGWYQREESVNAVGTLPPPVVQVPPVVPHEAHAPPLVLRLDDNAEGVMPEASHAQSVTEKSVVEQRSPRDPP